MDKLINKFFMAISLSFCLFESNILLSQTITLIDFGNTQVESTFDLTGWGTILLSPNINFTSEGNGGVIITSNADEFTDFRGVQGTPRQFSLGERIIVTWFNTSDDIISFTSRISFTDSDEPDGGTSSGNWYTMRSYDDYRITYSEIQPHSEAKTVFNITNFGVHKTDDIYSIVNVNLHIEWYETGPKEFMICDKIELSFDADVQAPGKPTNLTSNALSDSKINLQWDVPSLDQGVVEYLIYLNDEVEGYSDENSYTSVFLEPSTEYTFSITALDKAGNESQHSDNILASTNSFNHSNDLINPSGINYTGSFLLAEDFSWGGEALTYNPNGDGGQTGSGASDGFPGSFFVMNLNQPENGLVAEVSVPAPVISSSKNIDELNSVNILQDPANIRPDNINNLEFVDLWRTGLKYIDGEDRLYSSWNIYYTVTEDKHATISCCDASNLNSGTKYGAWHVGEKNTWPLDYCLSDWLFAIPDDWAMEHLNGRSLVTGRAREGGLSGLGPTMYAFSRLGFSFPPPETELEITTLLEYGRVEESEGHNFPNSIDGYNHSDLWRDADWISVNGQKAIAIIGDKARGNFWYGYIGESMRHDWVTADIPYPEFGSTDPNGKGWKSNNTIPMIIFYDPLDLYAVAIGTSESFEPQPYAALRIDEDIFWSIDREILSACYDSYNNYLFILEIIPEEEGRLIVHTFKIDEITNISYNNSLPEGYILYQNYPNPFNPSTVIKYKLQHDSDIKLVLYDVLGREIKTLVSGIKPAGEHEFILETSTISSGIYFYNLKTENFTSTRKLVLIK